MTGERSESAGERTDAARGYAVDGAGEAVVDAVATATAAGVVVVDEGAVTFANGRAERYLGRPPDALAGSAVGSVFPDRAVDAAEAVAATGAERSVAWTAPDADAPRVAATLAPAGDGRVVATLTAGEPSDDGAGEPVDDPASEPPDDPASDRHEAAPSDETDRAVVTLDADGTIAEWGPSATALTGWSAAEAVGAHVSLLSPDGADGDPMASLDRARTVGSVETAEWLLRADGSKFWALTAVRPVRNGAGRGDQFRLTLRDRTERKRLADERDLLATVNHAVADAETFRDGVETTLEAVCERTQWAYAEAWVPNDDGERLEHLTGHAESERLEPFLRASQSVTFAFDAGLPGRVWANGAAEWIPDAAAESADVFHRTDLAEEVGLQAALGVPIQTDDGVVAVLAFFLRERRAADEELAGAVTDVAADLGALMARKRAEDRLDRERSLLSRVFETTPVGLIVADADGRIARANCRAERIFDPSGGELAGNTFGELADGFLTPDGDAVPVAELPLARALATGEAVTDVELELVGNGDSATWVSVSAAPTGTPETGVERAVVVVENVTERREREQSLRTFRKAVEQAGHSVYVTDTDGTIEYVNPTFERVTGYGAEEAVGSDPSLLSSGEHDEEFFADIWETILGGDVWTGEVVNRRKSGERYVVNQTIAPIVDDSGTVERFVAINDEITEQKRRERELRRQRNSLERIKQIVESLRPINRQLARADTRDVIERQLCEGLTTSEAYLFAWIGDYNAAVGEVTPREWAGVDDEFVRDLNLSVDDDGGLDDVYRRAVVDGEVQVVRDIPTSPTAPDRRERALAYGFQSQAVIPVVYGDTVLGVVSVYSTRPDAFDEYERGLLRELGERVGHAINAAENRQLLHTDTVVELEFSVAAADSPAVAVARDLDCRLTLNSVAPAADEAYVCYFGVDGAAPESVAETLADRPGVERARVVEARGETGIVEVTGGFGPVATLVDHGATVRSFEVDGARGRLCGETAPQSDVEPIITDVEAAGEDTTFIAKRTRDRDARTLELTQTAVEERLTDRQREALALAYHAGFFASPRHSTGEELADVLGITPPTFYQHVREGTRKLLELLVDTEAAVPADIT